MFGPQSFEQARLVAEGQAQIAQMVAVAIERLFLVIRRNVARALATPQILP